MNIFQGCFKDGTEGTKDCRYFAAVYLMIRVIFYVESAILGNSQMYIVTASLLLISLLVLLYSPYKTPFFNKLDVVFIIILLLTLFVITGLHNKAYRIEKVDIMFSDLISLVPLVYLIIMSYTAYHSQEVKKIANLHSTSKGILLNKTNTCSEYTTCAK